MKQDLHMFTGKGGVGKSVVALAYAQSLAEKGEDTLLVELGDISYYGALLNLSVKYQPLALKNGLFLAKFSGFDCLREYVAYLVKVPRLADLFFDNKVMSAFVDAAPGLKELAILGKLTSGIRNWGPEFKYRHIVVDAHSSGHFMALLKAPMGLANVIDMGPMGEQSRNIFAALKNPQNVHYHIVSLPEEMPVTESLELGQEIKDLTGQTANYYLNKYIVDQSELEIQNTEFGQLYSVFRDNQNNKVLQSENLLKSKVENFQKLPFIFDVSPQVVADRLAHEIK